MRTTEINVLIFEGDLVKDNMDDGKLRRVSHFHDHGDDTASVYMTDGGVMGLDEISFNDIQSSWEDIEKNGTGLHPDRTFTITGYQPDKT
jgi:hypothetical protein